MTKTRNFADVIRQKLAADPELAAAVEKEMIKADIAAQKYEARRKSKKKE